MRSRLAELAKLFRSGTPAPIVNFRGLGQSRAQGLGELKSHHPCSEQETEKEEEEEKAAMKNEHALSEEPLQLPPPPFCPVFSPRQTELQPCSRRSSGDRDDRRESRMDSCG